MNILLIGGSGRITDAILEKLNKEGNRIYVLTGNSLKVHKYKHVFEQYRFSYESNSIKEIFESIMPDVTIFMGAYDTNFDWGRPREESVRYSAGLINILMGYSLVKSGRFIYLSSENVYNRSYPNDIKEESAAYARDFKSMVILQGEEMCNNYRKFEELDITILRLDNLCVIPANADDQLDICSCMCLNSLKFGKIEASDRRRFSMLYISDAVEFIYQIVKATELKHPLYHLSSSIEISEIELARLVQAQMGMPVEVIDNSVGDEYRIVLSNKRFGSEFNSDIRNKPDDIVKAVASYMKRHKKHFLYANNQENGILSRIFRGAGNVWKAIFPFLENMVCFIPFFMLNNRAVGSQFFNRLDFYLLYVLLFAIVHGQQQATFSAVLATAGYCFRQMYTRSGFEVMLDYNTYIWVAQLFILGLAVGYLRDKLSIVRREDKDEINYLSGQIDDIQDINLSNVRIKNVLEEQIVNHNQSIGTIYEITSELEKYAPEEVLFYAAEVVARLLGNCDVAIYRVDNEQYARLFSATSEKARKLGNSIIYTDMEEMYDELSQQRVYINKLLSPEYPLLADAIYDNEEMQILIFVWGISWERMNLSVANMLKVIGYLIQNAVLRANRYQEALEKERYREGTQVLEEAAFTALAKAYFDARDRGLTKCAILELTDDRAKIEHAEEIEKLLRKTDYIGELSDGKLYILLANTDGEGANVVVERLDRIGFKAVYQEDFDI